MKEKETVEINGIELQEGDSLNRYKALNLYNSFVGDSDPDEDVLKVTAEQLAENYPEAVDGDSAKVVHADLRASPGIHDDTGLMKYHGMVVENVNTNHGTTEISIKDWKEEQTFVFLSERDEPEQGSLYNFEPLDVLEKHLGVTILPVEKNA